jgi:hypothetical protein
MPTHKMKKAIYLLILLVLSSALLFLLLKLEKKEIKIADYNTTTADTTLKTDNILKTYGDTVFEIKLNDTATTRSNYTLSIESKTRMASVAR